MYGAIAEFVSTQHGDSAEFIGKARALATGVAQDHAPTRLYVIRIDNWFGPRWIGFAGTLTIGPVGRFPPIGMGVHKTRLHVPPFVPHRVVEQRVFLGPDFEDIATADPLHIECPSKEALSRRIAEIDKDGLFVWFTGASETQGRGAVMVYLPDHFDTRRSLRRGRFDICGAFYVGFSQSPAGWEPKMLRGISRTEVAHLEESGRALLCNSLSPTAGS